MLPLSVRIFLQVLIHGFFLERIFVFGMIAIVFFNHIGRVLDHYICCFAYHSIPLTITFITGFPRSGTTNFTRTVGGGASIFHTLAESLTLKYISTVLPVYKIIEFLLVAVGNSDSHALSETSEEDSMYLIHIWKGYTVVTMFPSITKNLPLLHDVMTITETDVDFVMTCYQRAAYFDQKRKQIGKNFFMQPHVHYILAKYKNTKFVVMYRNQAAMIASYAQHLSELVFWRDTMTADFETYFNRFAIQYMYRKVQPYIKKLQSDGNDRIFLLPASEWFEIATRDSLRQRLNVFLKLDDPIIAPMERQENHKKNAVYDHYFTLKSNRLTMKISKKQKYTIPGIIMYYFYYVYYFMIMGTYQYLQPTQPHKMIIFFLFCTAILPLLELFNIYHFGIHYSKNYPAYEKMISSFKTDEANVKGIFQNTGLHCSTIISLYFLYYVQIFEYNSIFDIRSYGYITGYMVLNQLVFDAVYSTMHWISHSHQVLYKYHKPHHEAHKDVSSINMGDNHWAETICALAAAFLFPSILHRYYGIKYPFFAFTVHVLTKLCQHSACPYAPFLFNPVLDCFFKPTIHHNIHHVSIVENFYTIPYSHCIYGWKYDEIKYKSLYYNDMQKQIKFDWNPIHHFIIMSALSLLFFGYNYNSY